MGSDAYGDAERALKEFTQAYLACVAFVDHSGKNYGRQRQAQT